MVVANLLQLILILGYLTQHTPLKLGLFLSEVRCRRLRAVAVLAHMVEELLGQVFGWARHSLVSLFSLA